MVGNLKETAFLTTKLNHIKILRDCENTCKFRTGKILTDWEREVKTKVQPYSRSYLQLMSLRKEISVMFPMECHCQYHLYTRTGHMPRKSWLHSVSFVLVAFVVLIFFNSVFFFLSFIYPFWFSIFISFLCFVFHLKRKEKNKTLDVCE